ncbi:hypothetical protein [Robertmurraya kyonggiensis]|uniref:Uncharacterized protein n=1 Tax=Robertmurraya kyonggiensis TaxID=1037680 RepID=A0A4U1D8H1_9BACI|nr:hypothetical protein [Robertmurraya kyonggiensis]TKC18812.1 hypothetical protein FA727_04445 [Robertmurraya kyonggiensis]
MFRHFLSLCIAFLTIFIVSTSHVGAAEESTTQLTYYSQHYFSENHDKEFAKKCMKESEGEKVEAQLIDQQWHLKDYFIFLLKNLYN